MAPPAPNFQFRSIVMPEIPPLWVKRDLPFCGHAPSATDVRWMAA